MKLIKWGAEGRAVVGASAEQLEHIPGLKTLRNGIAIGTDDALSVLLRRARTLDITLVPPAVDLAAWDGPEYLRKYQLEGIAWLVDQLGRDGGALLADDMGLGKTMQAIHAWQALGSPTALVVCPAATRHGWVKEFKRWADVDAVLVDTGKKMDALVQDRSPLVVITSYELAGRLPDHILPGLLAVDEVQNLRGRGAKRGRKLLPIAQGAAYRIGLSGTPMWSRPRDLWMVLRILFPTYRFGTAEQFDFAYCGAFINQWGGRVAKGMTRADELKHRLQWVQLRRTKEDVLAELPALTRTVRYVDGTTAAKRAMQAWAAQQLPLIEALNATLEAKIPAVIETVEEYDRPCLIFTWQKAHAREITRRLLAKDFPVMLMTGDQSLDERNRIVQRAAECKASVVATIDSAGTGVDGLQHVSSEGIFHALDYVALKLAQSEARLHRMGQKEAVRWTYLIMRGSADQLVEATVIEKLDAWRQVMGVDGAQGLTDALNGRQSGEAEAEVLKELMEAFHHMRGE